MAEQAQYVDVNGEKVPQTRINWIVHELLQIGNYAEDEQNADIGEALLMARAFGVIGLGNEFAIWQRAANEYRQRTKTHRVKSDLYSI